MFSPTEHGVCLLFFNNLQDSLKFAFFFFKCGCNEFLKKQKKHPQEILLTPLSLEMVGRSVATDPLLVVQRSEGRSEAKRQ